MPKNIFLDIYLFASGRITRQTRNYYSHRMRSQSGVSCKDALTIVNPLQDAHPAAQHRLRLPQSGRVPADPPLAGPLPRPAHARGIRPPPVLLAALSQRQTYTEMSAQVAKLAAEAWDYVSSLKLSKLDIDTVLPTSGLSLTPDKVQQLVRPVSDSLLSGAKLKP